MICGLTFEFYPYLFINFIVPHFNLFGLPSFTSLRSVTVGSEGSGEAFGGGFTPPLPLLSPIHFLVVVVVGRLVYQVV